MSLPGSRSRNDAHRQARTEALLHGAAKVPRTVHPAEANTVQKAANESGRAHVAVIGAREPDRGARFVVCVFRPDSGGPSPTQAVTPLNSVTR